MTHTFGPWRVRSKTYRRTNYNPDGAKVLSIVAGSEEWRDNKGHSHPDDAKYVVDEFAIIDVFGVDWDNTVPCVPNEDDARLIAAAPELLGACKVVLHHLTDFGDGINHGEHGDNPVQTLLCAVIAKAEGVCK